MSTADGVKSIGDAISAVGAAIRISHIPNAAQIGLMIESGGQYIAGASEALIESTGGRTDTEIAGRILTSYLVSTAGTDAAGMLIAARVPLMIAAMIYGAPVAGALGFAIGVFTFFGGAVLGAYVGEKIWDWGISPLININRDPLVLDLDGDGIELSALAGSDVHFDFSGDGFAERTGWVSADDGILAIDDNGNGVVDDGRELFGSSTQDGFAVLETLDSNQDGKIDASDAAFGKLRIWQDLNQNGVSEAGELLTLGDAGIASISLNRQSAGQLNAGHTVGYEAAFTRDDSTSDVIQSIYLQVDRQHSAADDSGGFTPASGVEKLPQLSGSGSIHSIAYKATVDVAFRSAWTALSNEALGMAPADLRARLATMMLLWAAVDGVSAESRGPYVDGRHLAFVEAFFGETYVEIQRGSDLRSYPSTLQFGAQIEGTFQAILSVFEVAFLAQVVPSALARGIIDEIAAYENPYLYYLFLDFGSGDPELSPTTLGNVGVVLDLITNGVPTDSGRAADYLVKALSGLDGIIQFAFNGDRETYATLAESHLSGITDSILHEVAIHIVDGTACMGTVQAEGLNGTSGQDVFIGGGGGDVVKGDAGSDIYVYGKHDGDLLIKDEGGALADTDRLVLTDLNLASISFDRIGDNLLIRVTETGKTISVQGFFDEGGAANGIDIIRFADGTEWSRAQIASASVYRGDGHANAIYDSSSDDVIYGGTGDDYIRISGGNDTILYGKGDGYDIIDDSSTAVSENDKLILTDLNLADVVLSRVNGHLIITVRSTGEYIDFDNFFPTNTGDWASSGRSIDAIQFADGTIWNRAQIQQSAWYRGTDRADGIGGAELNDTIEGGKGDDVLEGGQGSDTYIWRVGDGNDQISDSSSPLANTGNDINILSLVGVSKNQASFSYHGKTLLISIDSGEIITVPNFLWGVTNLLTGDGRLRPTNACRGTQR